MHRTKSQPRHRVFPNALAALVIAFALAGSGFSATNGPEDDLIALAVENELLDAEAIEANRIDIEIEDGVLVLSGVVDSLLAKRAAVDRAGAVRGVRSIVDQIVVAPSGRSDPEIEAAVNAALRQNPATEAFELDVDVEFGKVTIAGEVESHAESMLALDVIRDVAGVREVEDRIDVDAQPQRSDREIETELTSLLEWTAELDDADIEVEVEDGLAILTGDVATSRQRSLARAKALLAGATSVDARGLYVDWDAGGGERRAARYQEVTDEGIRDALHQAFGLDPRLVGQQPQVMVEDGAVTLRGEVHTLRARMAAEDVARHTTGVARVNNRIRVRSLEEPPDDSDMTAVINESLRRDPYTEHDDIIVRTRNAHAHLYGLVDTEFAKKRATFVASGAPGVVHVANYLTVRQEWEPKSDAAIRQDLEDKIAWTFAHAGEEIEVTIEDGVAILTGHVDTWMQWQKAMELAVEAGARRPHNQLEIHFRPTGATPHVYVPE